MSPITTGQLRAALRQFANRPFDHRTANCAITAADILSACARPDFAVDWRDLDARDQRALLRERGGLPGVVGSRFAEIPAGFARPGDIALLPGRGMPAAAIADPPNAWRQGRAGLVREALSTAITVYRVE